MTLFSISELALQAHARGSASLTIIPDTEQAAAFRSYFDTATLAIKQTDQLSTVSLAGQNTGGQVIQAAKAAVKRVTPTLSDSTKLLKPFAYSYISTEFNFYSHPGLDFVGPYGTPIQAMAAGCIVSTTDGWNGGYGKLTIEDIGGGYTIRYAHQERYAEGIEAGSCVDAGQTIGYVGLTGHTTGPHLHLELRRYGVPVRPNLY